MTSPKPRREAVGRTEVRVVPTDTHVRVHLFENRLPLPAKRSFRRAARDVQDADVGVALDAGHHGCEAVHRNLQDQITLGDPATDLCIDSPPMWPPVTFENSRLLLRAE